MYLKMFIGNIGSTWTYLFKGMPIAIGAKSNS